MISIQTVSKGLPSRKNEDAFRTFTNEENLIAVVADGMGGLCAGDIAANMVSDAICSTIVERLDACPVDSLQWAFEKADAILEEESRRIHCLMGTAVTAVYVSKIDKICYASWLGNVRLYLKRNSSISQLTTDHSVNVGYGRKCLTRCLKGCGLKGEVPYVRIPLQSEDSLFVCTDGFYNEHETMLLSLCKENFERKINSLILDDDMTVAAIWL